MGAQFQFKKFTVKTMQELEDEFHKEVKLCLYDHGHSGYTGTFAECDGIKVIPKVIRDEDDAYIYLIDVCEKWGPALAVMSGDDETWYVGAWCSS